MNDVSMGIKQTAILLSAQPYSIPDEKTERVSEGISIFCVPSASLEATSGLNGERGIKPTKLNLPYNCIDQLEDFPGYYNVTYMIKAQALKTQLVATRIEFISAVDAKPAQKGGK